MPYNPLVPNEANFVRGGTGDLVEMQDNFSDLAPLVSAYLISGTAPSADLQGFMLGSGTVGQFHIAVSGDRLRIDRISGGSVLQLVDFGQGAVDIRAFRAISGIDPTQTYHLVTRAYVDALTLDALATVDVTGAISGDLLRYDGTNWVDGRTQIAQLSDVALAGPVSGEALVYDGTQWVNQLVSGSGGGGSTTLSGLTDVFITSPVSGQALVFSGGSTWYNQTIVSDHGGLTGLGDDDHTQYSRADGTRPFTGTVSGIDPTLSGHLATKFYVDDTVATLSGLTISGAFNLPELLDVSDTATSSAVDGEVLTFSGGEWLNLAPTGGGGGGADILQVQIFS